MKLKPGNIIRHNHCLDTDLVIVKVVTATSEFVRLRVLYWNRHYKTIMDETPETIIIYKKDFNGWKKLGDLASGE